VFDRIITCCKLYLRPAIGSSAFIHALCLGPANRGEAVLHPHLAHMEIGSRKNELILLDACCGIDREAATCQFHDDPYDVRVEIIHIVPGNQDTKNEAAGRECCGGGLWHSCRFIAKKRQSPAAGLCFGWRVWM